jgi:hypothetical protein
MFLSFQKVLHITVDNIVKDSSKNNPTKYNYDIVQSLLFALVLLLNLFYFYKILVGLEGN